MITANIEGIGPVEFEDGTTQEVIQAKVKELVTGIDPRTGQKVGEIKAPPTFGQEVKRAVVEEGPQAVGGIVAGVAAAASGVGLPATVGAVALGGGFGESIKQIGQHLSGSLGKPQTSLDAAKRITVAGVEEGAWETIGGLAAKGVRKILAPFQRTTEAGAKATREFFQDKIKPLVFLPAESTESRTLDMLQNVAESSLIGGNTIAEFKSNRVKFFDDFADSMIDQFGERMDPSALGDLFVETISNKRKVHNQAAEVLYNNVADIIGPDKEVIKEVVERVDTGLVDGTGKAVMRDVTKKVKSTVPAISVPTMALKKFIGPLRKISEELGSIESKNAGDDLIALIDDLPETITFDAARELRSRLISRVDEFSVLNKKAPAIGKAKRMISLVDEAITTQLRKDNPEALEAWRTANQFWKQGQKQFNNTMIRRMVKLADETGTGAEMIAPAVFRPGQVSKVRRVKAALDPQTWNKMRGFFMQHLLQKSTDVDGVIQGKRLINNISGKPGSFGVPMMKETFTAPQIDAINKFGRALELTQKRQSEGAGKVLIQLSQAGAMMSIATRGLELPSATIMFGPVLLGKLMTNPQAAHWLTEGITIPAGSEKAAGLMSRLIGAANRIERGREVDEK